MMKIAILWLMASTIPVPQETVLVKGVLEYSPVEGGVWTIRYRDVVYDLHGDRQGLIAGEKVLVKGRVVKNRVCVHQVGVVFQIESIDRLKSPGEPGLTPPPYGINSPSIQEVSP
jgi:hypothetical protein